MLKKSHQNALVEFGRKKTLTQLLQDGQADAQREG